ncbi:MAG TPA: deoxyribodipyrimidine photo-lyase, partial [bacterium]|nr:deoxyribodipyrimidine photo-lyase [bacterium]
MIEPERIQLLNDKPQRDGEYVLYWMQASQRAEYNHALEYAIQEANRLRLPLVAVFGITEKFPEANERHYAFMLEGLRETRQALQERGIQMVVVRQS